MDEIIPLHEFSGQIHANTKNMGMGLTDIWHNGKIANI
jgi:hypothetical protein